MTNYKQHDYPTIGTYHQHPILPTEDICFLQAFEPWTAVKQSMVKMGTTPADYQVPTGKTFHAVELVIVQRAISANIYLYEADTADAITLQKAYVLSNHTAQTVFSVPLHFSIASGKFLTHWVTVANAYYSCILMGYETTD